MRHYLIPYLIKPVHISVLHSIQIEDTSFAQIEMLSYRMYGKKNFFLFIPEQARNNNENQGTLGGGGFNNV